MSNGDSLSAGHRFTGSLNEQRIGVVGFVGGDRLRGNTHDQVVRLRDAVSCPAMKLPARKVAQSFGRRVNPGCQAAAQAADRLVAEFFFWGSGRMLVDSDDGGIEEHLLELRVSGALGEDAMADGSIGPP